MYSPPFRCSNFPTNVFKIKLNIQDAFTHLRKNLGSYPQSRHQSYYIWMNPNSPLAIVNAVVTFLIFGELVTNSPLRSFLFHFLHHFSIFYFYISLDKFKECWNFLIISVLLNPDIISEKSLIVLLIFETQRRLQHGAPLNAQRASSSTLFIHIVSVSQRNLLENIVKLCRYFPTRSNGGGAWGECLRRTLESRRMRKIFLKVFPFNNLILVIPCESYAAYYLYF